MSIEKSENIEDILKSSPLNETIANNLVKAYSIINSPLYKKIACTVSGGSDSDIMLDIVWKCDKENKADYIWFDTGLEYQATKDHLQYLEERYGIEIKTYRAIKPIPTSCKEYGQPFLSKQVSEMIQRLQSHDFKWEDEPFDVLYERYPKCKVALKWWCNQFEEKDGKESKFNIAYNKYLKEFMVAYPPKHKISNKCCKYSKKMLADRLMKENGYDLNCTGVRKSEGGARSSAYKSCFDEQCGSFDNYRPLFWYGNSDKENYEKQNDIKHSKCYTCYGLKRTGCAGCPYGRDFEYELEVIREYEPKLYIAVNNIFGESYEYTRKYKEFVASKNKEDEQIEGQIDIWQYEYYQNNLSKESEV